MHPHLHTKDNRGKLLIAPNALHYWPDYFPGCEEVMRILDQCHAVGFLHKALGNCSQAKQAVNKCLRSERLARTAENKEASRVRKEKLETAWAEIEASSQST